MSADALIGATTARTAVRYGSPPLVTCLSILKRSRERKEEIVMNARPELPNVVLVHGAFADGSGWRGVYDLLTQDGYHVAVVQNPTLSLQGDTAATRLIIDAQDGPVV